MKYLVIIAVVAVLLIGLRYAMPRFGTSKALGVVNTGGLDQLADCPDTPNCQGSQSSDPKQRVKTFNFTGQENPIAFIEAALSKEPGVRTVTLDEHYLHVTFSTKIFNFTDDVEFYQPAGSNDVQVRSASRLGVSDLGANLKRIDNLRQLLSKP